MELNFRRIAIVNRAEPAMRLVHAVRELNQEHGHRLRTIAFYTDPDRLSMFVREADEAICLGTATFVDAKDGQRKSRYLDYEALERALVESRAQAVWVGWGFVSEHAEFADLCARLGIAFIGPKGDVMRRVGDKIASKLLAESAQVPVAPWSNGPVETVEQAVAHAERLGFPLMIKASAGGGGRGVRRVLSREALTDAFGSAQSEALKFFGSSIVFLERAIVGARHVEVQVLGDHHGACWAVGVRDCTLQRRNQKVVEEAPLPFANPEFEARLRQAAVRICRAAGYTNAGTVEFLFHSATGEFFFMEMNTRLQVEHPVTEATTGIDLVKMQLHLANGGRLEGDAPATLGHAIEVRLNAEDPDNQFSPAPGRVDLFRLPTGPGLRIDTGVCPGDVIAAEFDSMIAKLIAYGRNRDEAMARMRRALLETAVVVRGGTTNKAFLLELLSHTDVVENRTDIGWLDRTWSTDGRKIRAHASVALLQAALDVYSREFAIELKNYFVSASRGRPTARSEVGRNVELRYLGQNYVLRTRHLGPNRYRVTVDGVSVDAHVNVRGEFERWLTVSGVRHPVVSVVDGVRHLVEVDGIPHTISRDDGGIIRAPAPCVALAVHVSVGDSVAAGTPLLTLEAMKMEMAITAPYAGRVRQVKVRANVQVAAGDPLVVIDPTADAKQVESAPRVSFSENPGTSLPPASPPLHVMLDEMRHLVLGYEIDAAEAKTIRQSLGSLRAAPDVDDPLVWTTENDILAIFADIQTLYRDEPTGAFEQRVSAEENLLNYLRAVHHAGQGLPSAFVHKLERALRHYGVAGLEPTGGLDEALIFIHKAQRRSDECAAQAFTLLEHRVEHADQLMRLADPTFRDLLDRLIAATQDAYLAVNDLAREARFRYFDRPLLEETRLQARQRLDTVLQRLAAHDAARSRQTLLNDLVECPHGLQRLFATVARHDSAEVRWASLEAIFRRFYRLSRLERVRQLRDRPLLILGAECHAQDGVLYALATHSAHSDLERTLTQLSGALSDYGDSDRIAVDLYLSCDGAVPEADAVRQQLLDGLAQAGISRPLTHICVVLSDESLDRPVQCHTFVPVEGGGYCEHDMHPGMHPMAAERMELWRLRNFKVKQLKAMEHVYLFHAVAHNNPRDERLFALVDVCDTTPLRGKSGEIQGLPHLEHLYLEAVAGIREFQARRSPRDRLHWNRIVLFLWSQAALTNSEMIRIAKRMAPTSSHLGLEKIVVRMRSEDETTGDIQNRVLHISNRAGTGLRAHFDSVSAEPIRTLTAYDQRVIQMRRLGMVYPYEIIRMLTPSRDADQAEFPPGEFTEYDWFEGQGLLAVRRAPGLNQANLVVGVIRNFTTKYPEGMTRVMILGDASRDMGALAEPECARIIAAIDLAERLKVPVDWFPVSSGAKIAMDVGTEGLDWVALVLRRIIEYTQRGGEMNVVVAGVNVGGQSYWNAEATMLMHTKGILVMTPQGSMVLTGKRALDYSGSVSAETNQGIGGFERVMGPNGQAQYSARSIADACHILLQHYEHAYVAPGERFPRRGTTTDPKNRDVRSAPHAAVNGTGFTCVGDVFSLEKNPGRKKPFDIRSVMQAVIDQDHVPFERWLLMRNAETAVTWDAHLGGIPVSLIGIESKPLSRVGRVPGDGPETWSGGTLFPQSSKKVARAINAASGNRPVAILANLSGFDGSPESMRELQLEFGAEIGRAVVNFDGPMVFCVISRYHGGAYVVFSRTLNANLEVAALEGSHASVIGGAPAAAVVFPGEVKTRALADPRIKELQQQLAKASDWEKPRVAARYDEMYRQVYAEKQGEVAELFDQIHSVQRAEQVGSLHRIIPADQLRPYLIDAIERGIARVLDAMPPKTQSRLAEHRPGELGL